MKEYFSVSVSNYTPEKDFTVVRPASLDHPKNNAVMFISNGYMDQADVFRKVRNCLVFWPKETVDIPSYMEENHAVILCDDPHNRYCRFFAENHITYRQGMEEYEVVYGAYVAKDAKIGKNPTIFPGAYIGGEVTLGDNVYIGAGAKLIGEVTIGNNVLIGENSVIGADGLSTDRDEYGHALTMPQFGGIVIEDNVQIGALTIIARGAIDNTIIRTGCKIDNGCFISHNVEMGTDTFIVGETILFGSSSTGEQVLISGNSAIRNGVHIGSKAVVGMGSVVTRDIAPNKVAAGVPAKEIRDNIQ